jgi:hypothetical protein
MSSYGWPDWLWQRVGWRVWLRHWHLHARIARWHDNRGR